MVIDFTSDEFKELKDKLIIEFNQYLKESDLEKYYDLIKDLLDILDDKNNMLKSLVDVELSYVFGNHISWDIIGNYYRSLDINNNVDAETRISSLIIVLYVCIYKTWILAKQDTVFYKEYVNTIQKLFNHSIVLENYDRHIILEYPYYYLNELYRAYTNNKGKIDKTYDVISNFESHMETIEKYSKTIEKYTSDVSAIETKLEKQRQEFNFIRLADAFQKMKDDKQEELKNEKAWNNFLQIIIVLLLFSKILIAVSDRFNDFSAGFVMTSISMILFIAVVIYFFRISLINIKSIKSQILQLDLRLSLCQFIHNYAEDSEKMRSENMKDSLDRFESIIFSPIVANEEQIPTTFDNLDQFIKVMNLVNGAKSGNNQTNENKQN